MEKNFFKLLAKSNALRKNKKFLRKENPQEFKVFLSFLVTIEANLHYLDKTEYLRLAKDFLAGQMTADDFSYTFIAIYEGINRKLRQMERDESSDLANFLSPQRRDFGELLARIYGSCDSYSPNPDFNTVDEQELKTYAQILLLKLQEDKLLSNP